MSCFKENVGGSNSVWYKIIMKDGETIEGIGYLYSCIDLLSHNLRIITLDLFFRFFMFLGHFFYIYLLGIHTFFFIWCWKILSYLKPSLLYFMIRVNRNSIFFKIILVLISALGNLRVSYQNNEILTGNRKKVI